MAAAAEKGKEEHNNHKRGSVVGIAAGLISQADTTPTDPSRERELSVDGVLPVERSFDALSSRPLVLCIGKREGEQREESC